MSTPSFEDDETLASPVEGVSLSLDAVAETRASDAPPTKNTTGTGSGAIEAAARGVVHLVEGSTPHLNEETREILRRRLLMASTLLFTGFFLFLIRNFFFGEETFQLRDAEVQEFVRKEAHWLWVSHVGLTSILGLVVISLYRLRDASLTALRLAEYATFGLTALFFTLITHFRLEVGAWLEMGAHLPVVVGPWMMLVFTYVLFIPNTWRRSLRLLVPATLLPIGVILMQDNMCPGFQQCVLYRFNANYVTEQILLLSLMFTTAVVGVHTINTLRKEAFEAKQLGQYRLKQPIGAGGMGEVYLAEHQMMKRPCAIKIIRPDKAGDPRTLARFEREVRSTAKLSHWNSIDIFDYGRTDDGTFYYVMEYLPGYNIGELVQQEGPLSPARAIYLMDQVCRAMAEAHGIGLVHRDIKPANIFCAYRGGEFDVAKLLDFGLAKPTLEAKQNEPGAAELTQEGAITGSPMFMSPEQATGEREADTRSDIYSLGCVLYFLVTGRPPYEYNQPVKVIIAHASEEVTPPREHNPDLPIELEDVILHCLEKDAEDRFQTVEDLRLALEDIPLADEWSSELAADWWNCNGCKKRKAMAEAAVEAAAV